MTMLFGYFIPLSRFSRSHIMLSMYNISVNPVRCPGDSLSATSTHASVAGRVGNMSRQFFSLSLDAFKACTNLRSFSWTGGGFLSANNVDVLAYLDIIIQQNFRLRNLVIRSSPGLSAEVWERLVKIKSLESLSIWSLELDPSVLEKWFNELKGTLTSLRLGINSLPYQPIECKPP